jgi:hypothetical protein
VDADSWRRNDRGAYPDTFLDGDVRAQRFYEARGGRRVDRDQVHPPGGDPSRLCGEVPKLRYTWPDPTRLLITGVSRGDRLAPPRAEV